MIRSATACARAEQHERGDDDESHVARTGNPQPSLKRMGSGFVVEIAADVIVFDHGPGSHHRLLQTGKRATDVTHAFFSHLQYDHFVDFPRLR
jgi:ribonuclease Z